ncbi:hypothetical protein CsSME_00042775 [Camellia sinensis var. sinensis]
MASDLCIERKDSKWEISDSPAKKQRCEDYGSPPPLCSSAEEEKEKEKEDPRSKIVVYNYDDSDVEDDSDGMHEFTEREYQEHHRQMTESDGFDVMSFPRSFACGTTTPLSNFNEIADDLKAFSELALKEYNEKEVYFFIQLKFCFVLFCFVLFCVCARVRFFYFYFYFY